MWRAELHVQGKTGKGIIRIPVLFHPILSPFFSTLLLPIFLSGVPYVPLSLMRNYGFPSCRYNVTPEVRHESR